MIRQWVGCLLCASGLLSAFAAEPPPTLRVLFLGDNGHHRPEDRFKQLEPVLAKQRIRLEYTGSLDDLSPAKLAGYDCLFIFANHTKISPDQEKALMDFVAAGGGLVPIHCASYCFLNSPKYIELVGGQFKSHNTGVFKETIVNAEHPIMAGLSPIESWDETYVHTRHNTNRIVLAERREGDKAEPYTWVREHGKGRVFYTAWGHDERTWSNENFQRLVENGIRWASEKSPSLLQKRAGLTPFEYMDAPDALPNYVAGAKWGTQAEPIRTMQKPLAPEESQKHLVTFPGFTTSLFAAEPDVAKPIWMTWDTRGRLWVAETVDYPNDMQPPGEGHDRIKICEDTDGDGRADKFTIFADKLSVPTGFVFANGGVIVVHSGKTEFLKDTDGDDKADVRRILFTGWGTRDTHAGPSNLRYGFDNWIWGTVGYSGFEGVVGGKSIRFGQGIYRFKPDGSVLEFVRSSNNNTWGLGLSEDNLIFGSTANGNASMYMPIPNRYYEGVSGWSARRLEKSADSQDYFAITDKTRQMDWHGKYTAGAGSALYTARSFPPEYWNRVQFVAEPTGHLLGKFHLEAKGADFVAHNGRNFAASDDEWTSPICAEVGPDGALWVIDWYNYIIQHNPTPIGRTTGKGNAYETPIRDKTHGRIYRIAYAKSSPAPTTAIELRDERANSLLSPALSSTEPVRPSRGEGEERGRSAPIPSALHLDKATPEELVHALENDNLLWRMTAQRLLVERGQTDVVPALCALARNKTTDQTAQRPAAIHALWTLQGLNALQSASTAVAEAVEAALQHPAAGVRRAAVTVAPRSSSWLEKILRYNLLEDGDAQVRMATLLALSEMPTSETAGASVFTMLQETRNSQDRWIPDAATCAAARHDWSFLKSALADGRTNSPGTSRATAFDQVLQRVTAHYADRGPTDSVMSVLNALNGRAAAATAVLEGLVTGWPKDKVPVITDADARALGLLMQSLPDSSRSRLLRLARKWGREDLFADAVKTVAATLAAKVADEALPAEQRSAAAKDLINLQDRSGSIEAVVSQVKLLTAPDLATGLISSLAESRQAETGRELVNRWSQLTPAAHRAAISVLLRRVEWAAALLDAVESGAIRRADLAAEQWSQLKQNLNSTLAERAEKLSTAAGTITADRAEIIRTLLPLAKEPGDSARGKEVFTTTCAVCHTFGGQGGKVGPELTGIGARDRAEILIDILDPNRSVEANYRMWNVSTKDGETYSGRLESETQTTVEILDSSGHNHVIQRKEIERLNGSQLSIMPNGFESLPAADLKALLTYLTAPGK